MKSQLYFSRALLLALLLGCLAASSCLADAPLEGTKPAQWRLVWLDDPATTATLAWNTADQGSVHSARFWQKGKPDTEASRVAESGRYTGGEVELFYHHARLNDLQPGTIYEVQMISDQEKSPVFHFETAPAMDRPFSILHGGDSRSDRDARRGINTMIANMVSESLANEDPADDILALAHGGDYIVSGPNLEQWSVWMSDHELNVTKENLLLPIIAERGNHDRGQPFQEVFGYPADDLNYFAINIGPKMRFVTLNSETSTAGDQAKWLEAELKSARPDNRWVLTQYHRPVYPAVKTAGSGLLSWVPLFEKYNIDLACEADGHNIKRTVPIRNNKPDPTGIVYIGEGGMGVGQRTPKTDRWFLQAPGMADKGDHIFVLTFEEETLKGKCVLVDGTIRDTFERKVRE